MAVVGSGLVVGMSWMPLAADSCTCVVKCNHGLSRRNGVCFGCSRPQESWCHEGEKRCDRGDKDSRDREVVKIELEPPCKGRGNGPRK
jgi:hypothetical protein